MPIVSTHPGLVNSELPTASQLPAPRRRRKDFLITSIVLSYPPLPSPAISYACDFHDGTDWRSRCPEGPAAAFAIAPSPVLVLVSRSQRLQLRSQARLAFASAVRARHVAAGHPLLSCPGGVLRCILPPLRTRGRRRADEGPAFPEFRLASLAFEPIRTTDIQYGRRMCSPPS